MWMKIKCSCGHYEDIELLGKAAERDRKKEFFETQGVCKECYKKSLDKQAAVGCEIIRMDYRGHFKKFFEWCNKVRDSYNSETKTIDVYIPVDVVPFAKAIVDGNSDSQYEALVQLFRSKGKHLQKIMQNLSDEYKAGLKDYCSINHPELIK